jgi:uncharacterized coiled-coil protein SlyX
MSPVPDARLVELETRLLFQERALEELLEASQLQARELEELRERLARLEVRPSLADETRGPG